MAFKKLLTLAMAAATTIAPIAINSTGVTTSQAQAAAPVEFDEVDAQVLGFNMLASGMISGIGAHYKGRDFWKAFTRGALVSGPLIYTGQKMAAYSGEYPGLMWGGKICPFRRCLNKGQHSLGQWYAQQVPD